MHVLRMTVAEECGRGGFLLFFIKSCRESHEPGPGKQPDNGKSGGFEPGDVPVGGAGGQPDGGLKQQER